MSFFELEPSDITSLNDADLRELVGRLCEAELVREKLSPSCVYWGGEQEAPDGGLDVRVSSSSALTHLGFIKSKNTGFQVKKHSMGKAACKKEMMDKGGLKPVIANLIDKGGAYIIVSGRDDCTDKMLDQRIEGMKSALVGYPNKEKLNVDFYGRDRLAAWLRQFPGVALWARSRLGKQLSGWKPFGHWSGVLSENEDEFLLGDHPCVIDSNSENKTPVTISEGIRLVRERLIKKSSAVRIIGLSGVGKTRFAQALFEEKVGESPLSKTNVIYADLGDDLTPSASELLSYLIANNLQGYVVLDNCPDETHKKIQKELKLSEANLSLLTIEYDISEDRPEETEVIEIRPSGEELVSRLVQKKFPLLEHVNAHKISEFSGGNARLAIALASRVGADETLINFSDDELFERLFNQRKGANDNLLESAEILSLVYSFNVSTEKYNNELAVLSSLSEISRRTLGRDIAELMRRQIVQKRGDWRAVLPHASANRLAKRALESLQPEEINSELLKENNLRLLKSCAHRLGYLHDFEPAKELALTWLQPNGPFSDITFCKGETLEALKYVAPVFPGVVLTAIEKSSNVAGFCSRENPNYSFFVKLLVKIAYEEKYFIRSAEILLRFAEKEESDQMHNSTISELSSLFTLYLSGTLASPEVRRSFVSKLLNSGAKKHFEISKKIFQSAFQASGWTALGGFDFGARKRSYGWVPKTQLDESDWFNGFLNLLITMFESEDAERSAWAKSIVKNHFQQLWQYDGCHELLEQIVIKHTSDRPWVDIWISIKETIYYIELDDDDCDIELLIRLKNLEVLTAPKSSDLSSQIEAYVLKNKSIHIGIQSKNYSACEKEISEKVVKLGELVALNLDFLESCSHKLFEKYTDSLGDFGKGLAKGSLNKLLLFDDLVHLMQQEKIKEISPILFFGFISGVHEEDPVLSRQIQESVLDVPELKPHFADILAATPIEPWGIKKLIELAQNAELEPYRFERASRLRSGINDDDFSELLLAVNQLDDGIFTAIEMLMMRSLMNKNEGYKPSERLKLIGRRMIIKTFEMERSDFNRIKNYDFDRFIKICLSEPVPENEIAEIVDVFCSRVESGRLYGFELQSFTSLLTEQYPECVFDRVYKNVEDNHLPYLLFRENLDHPASIVNSIQFDRLEKWCNGNIEKIKLVVSALTVFEPKQKESSRLNDGHPRVLSKHVKKFLDVSNKKIEIVEHVYKNISPESWSESRASVLESRSKAFSELLEYPDSKVNQFVLQKLEELQKSIRSEREYEASRNTEYEQRFE